MRSSFFLMVLMAVVALSGCASMFKNKLRAISASDLDCSEEELQLKSLNGTWAWAGSQAEVRGCGKRARYVLAQPGWVLNSPIRETEK